MQLGRGLNSYIFALMSNQPKIKNVYTSIGQPLEISGNGTEVLKIAITPKFIRYFIEQPADRTIVFYGEYTLYSTSNNEELTIQLSNILAKDTFLGKLYQGVKVCWFTDFDIIPAIFFDENELTPDTVFNTIIDSEANFIFNVPATLNNSIKPKYSNVSYYHSGAVLIETLRQQGLASTDKLFINIQAEQIEIVYFDEEGKLRIYNRYDYKAYQDYIYFVLLVANEMQIDREKVRAVLLGEISTDSQLYEVTYRYFMQVSLIAQPENIRFSRAFAEYPKHFNYSLYNL